MVAVVVMGSYIGGRWGAIWEGDWWGAVWECLVESFLGGRKSYMGTSGGELYGRESQTDKNGFPAPVENQERPFPSANFYNGLKSLQ